MVLVVVKAMNVVAAWAVVLAARREPAPEREPQDARAISAAVPQALRVHSPKSWPKPSNRPLAPEFHHAWIGSDILFT